MHLCHLLTLQVPLAILGVGGSHHFSNSQIHDLSTSNNIDISSIFLTAYRICHTPVCPGAILQFTLLLVKWKPKLIMVRHQL